MSQNGVFVWLFLDFGLLPSIRTTHPYPWPMLSFTLLPPTPYPLCFLPLPSLLMLTSFILTQLKSALDRVPTTIFRLICIPQFPLQINCPRFSQNWEFPDEWLGEDSFIRLLSLCCHSSTDNFSYISPSFETTSLICYQIAWAQVPTLRC